VKCPFKMRAFDRPDECDEECAWLIRAMDLREGSRESYLACAVAVNASGSDFDLFKSPANWIEEDIVIGGTE